MSNFDNYTFALYILAFILTGVIAGRKRRTEAADFYIRQNHLPWYVIGFSLVAAGISSEQFIGTVGAVYSRGLVTANWEWGIAPAVIIMVVFFVPYYLKNKILTTPGFLERRFDKRVSSLYAILSVFIYVFINLAGVLYSGGFAMSQILGINIYVCIVIIAVVVGFFSIYGGMASLAWTSVLQASMLLGGGFLIFVLGLSHIDGGLSAIIGEGERAHLIRPATDHEIPWTALLVLMFSTNIWYYCTSQNINQSVLGAKNRWNGRIGLIFAGFLLLFVPLADVFPGLIAYKLNPDLPKADMAFVFVTQELLPVGGAGIMYGVLIFSVVTAVLSGINGVSTIFAFDIYKKYSKKQVDDKHLIKVGRFFSASVLIIGALYTPVVGSFKHIFDFFQECWAFVAVPISLTFLLGIFFKRMSSKLAFYLMLFTFPMFLMPYIVKLLGITMNIFNVAGIVWIITFFASLLYMFLVGNPDRNEEKTLFLFERTQVPWFKNIILWALVMVACYFTIYFLLW